MLSRYIDKKYCYCFQFKKILSNVVPSVLSDMDEIVGTLNTFSSRLCFTTLYGSEHRAVDYPSRAEGLERMYSRGHFQPHRITEC